MFEVRPGTVFLPTEEYLYVFDRFKKRKFKFDETINLKNLEALKLNEPIKSEALMENHLYGFLNENKFLIKHTGLENPMYERIYRYIGGMEGYELENREESWGKIKSTTILIVGLGGLGTWVLQSLIMLGFQSFLLVDNDTVERSNLNRQLFFGIKDEGLSKVEVLKREIDEKYPHISVKTYKTFISSSKCLETILEKELVDLVVSCADKPLWKIRRWVSEACTKCNVISVFISGSRLGPMILPGQTGCMECEWLKQVDSGQNINISRADLIPQVKRGSICTDPMFEVSKFTKEILSHFLLGKTRMYGALVNLNDGQAHRVEKRSDCPVCSMKGGDLYAEQQSSRK